MTYTKKMHTSARRQTVGKHNIVTDLLDEIERLQGELSAMDTALRNLEYAERRYRSAHDKHGDTDIRTGHAWDDMRRCGDKARQAINDHINDAVEMPPLVDFLMNPKEK